MGIKTASRLPLLALVAVCLVSFGVRAAWIGLPCHGSCNTTSSHLLIFDERYYVNAARVIAGVRPPALPGTAYRHAPLGSDPNAEHPQLAKLIMAGSIDLVGDGPWGWRLGSLIFGTLAILGMFALVRWAGGGPWLAVGAAALMAADNLMLVAGRIGILEIYVVAAMIWSVALYVRGQPLLAGIVAGIGACMKLFALDVVVVLALLELLRWRAGGRTELRKLAEAVAAGAASFIGLLAILGEVAPPYDNSAGRFVSGGPFGHLAHMVSYAAHQTGMSVAHGIASEPWEWLADYKPIAYLTIDPAHPGALVGDHPAVHFLGLVSPPILLAGVVGMALVLWHTLRPKGRAGASSDRAAASGQPVPWLARSSGGELQRVSSAWFLGTFGPFLIAGLAFDRTSYLYYMTIVMPALYIAGAWLAGGLRDRPWVFWPWVFLVAASAVVFYPFTPLP
jgi:hypothetical protein